MKKIALLIEDDEGIRDLVLAQVESLGMHLDYAADGRGGLEMALASEYEIIILDIMLPELGGVEVCQKIRERDSDVPIIMLTARSDELDRVMGLELGADDYLTKPFSVMELKARIKALLRRSRRQKSKDADSESQALLEYGPLVIDRDKHRVTLDGEAISFSATEFEVLAFLAERPGKPFTRGQLLAAVWGYENVVYENSVSTYINKIRKKIEEDPNNPRFVKTVWGVGYRFVELEELSSETPQE